MKAVLIILSIILQLNCIKGIFKHHDGTNLMTDHFVNKTIWHVRTFVATDHKIYNFELEDTHDKVCFLGPRRKTKTDEYIYLKDEGRFDGPYRRFKYYTSKETVRVEEMELQKDEKTGEESLYVSGKTSYIGPDGVRYIFSFEADKNGYRPVVLFGRDVEIAESSVKCRMYVPPPDAGISDGLIGSLVGSGFF